MQIFMRLLCPITAPLAKPFGFSRPLFVIGYSIFGSVMAGGTPAIRTAGILPAFPLEKSKSAGRLTGLWENW
jgi:hypothetical protein